MCSQVWSYDRGREGIWPQEVILIHCVLKFVSCDCLKYGKAECWEGSGPFTKSLILFRSSMQAGHPGGAMTTTTCLPWKQKYLPTQLIKTLISLLTISDFFSISPEWGWAMWYVTTFFMCLKAETYLGITLLTNTTQFLLNPSCTSFTESRLTSCTSFTGFWGFVLSREGSFTLSRTAYRCVQ